jgi:hypothetical protein
MNGTLMEKARSMLNGAGLGHELWAETVGTAYFLVNRSLPSTLVDKTSREAWTSKKPSLEHLRVFGCEHSDMAHNGYFVKVNVFIVESKIIVAMVFLMPVVFYVFLRIWGIKASAIMIYLHSSMVSGCLFFSFCSILNYPLLLPPLGIHIRLQLLMYISKSIGISSNLRFPSGFPHFHPS